jgi:hypothetical protein
MAAPVQAQELEPRAYSPAPVGANFLVFTHGRSRGEVLFDPSLRTSDVSSRLQVSAAAYVRTVDVFGRSGSVAFALPFIVGNLSGNVGEGRTTVDRSGFGDARLRLAVNLSGGPAMSPAEFAAREPGLAMGASLTVVAPTGEHEAARLINIGANRWAFKPEIGVTRDFDRWFVEGAAGVWWFTDNTAFLGSGTQEQEPLATVQLHGGYRFGPGLWLATSATYYAGGRTVVNGIAGDTLQENTRFGLTLSVPVDRQWSVKVAASSGVIVRAGGDFTTLTVSAQYLWFDR